MMTFITEGTLPFEKDFPIIKKNIELGVHFIDNSFETSINMVLLQYKTSPSFSNNTMCKKYGMQSKKKQNVAFMSTFTQEKKRKLLTTGDPETEFKLITGLEEVNLVREVNWAPIIGVLNELLEN